MFDFATYDAFNWFMFLLFVGLPALFCLGVFLRVLWYAFTEKGRETFKREELELKQRKRGRKRILKKQRPSPDEQFDLFLKTKDPIKVRDNYLRS